MQSDRKVDSNDSIVHAWFNRYGPDLTRRCQAFFRFLRVDEREEAVAETMASIVKYAVSASARGKLKDLTPYTLVLYFGRSVRAGRRMAGSRSNDVLSRCTHRPYSGSVVYLDHLVPIRSDVGEVKERLSDGLASSREHSPFEHARRNLDYPAILDMEHVSLKARRVFGFLAETHGAGSQKELARALKLSPGRITQIKRHLAGCLSRHGYSSI